MKMVLEINGTWNTKENLNLNELIFVFWRWILLVEKIESKKNELVIPKFDYSYGVCIQMFYPPDGCYRVNHRY
jgi:hypothetical protein